MIIWYILIVIMCLFLSCEYYAWKTGVPTIASFPSARKKIVDILRQNISADTKTKPFTIIDLGSGNGQLTQKIARAFPQAHVTGIELSFVPWLISVLSRVLFGPKNLEYQRIDFWRYDCSSVDAVIVYVTENIIERVGEKLRKELKKDAIIIANDTALRGDWTPVETVATGFLKFQVFLYRQ